MRIPLAVVGAMIAVLCIALISYLPGPVEAQGETTGGIPPGTQANGQDTENTSSPPDLVVVAADDCTVASDGSKVSITLSDGDGTRARFVDGQRNVTITAPSGRPRIQGPTADFIGDHATFTSDPGFDTDGDYTVVTSEGITCQDAAGTPPPSGGQQDGPCANPREVVSIGPTTTDTERKNVRITGETFRVTYDVEILDPDGFASVVIDVSGRFGEGPFVIVDESGGDRFISTVSPGTFDVTVSVNPPNEARYTLTIEDCRGGDGGGGTADDLDCASFNSQAEAQANLDANPSDPNNLDADDDGEACEVFDYGNDGGNEGGGGGADLDCADFDSQAEAQATFDADPSDPNGLDADDDSEACEDFDYDEEIINIPGDPLPPTGGIPVPLVALALLVMAGIMGARELKL